MDVLTASLRSAYFLRCGHFVSSLCPAWGFPFVHGVSPFLMNISQGQRQRENQSFDDIHRVVRH
ncbi:Uncharacterised protein [Yersinia enterocolitica]|nr:Uncharacterised protein [Yersinia enterocolitica]CRX91130.1 Uncharacterised protein [Yersinia enterocolitica]